MAGTEVMCSFNTPDICVSRKGQESTQWAAWTVAGERRRRYGRKQCVWEVVVVVEVVVKM